MWQLGMPMRRGTIFGRCQCTHGWRAEILFYLSLGDAKIGGICMLVLSAGHGINIHRASAIAWRQLAMSAALSIIGAWHHRVSCLVMAWRIGRK